MTLALLDGCADLMGRTDRQRPSRESAKLKPGQWLPIAIWGSLILSSEPEWVQQSEPLSLLYNSPEDSRKGPYWFEPPGLQLHWGGSTAQHWRKSDSEGTSELFQQKPMTNRQGILAQIKGSIQKHYGSNCGQGRATHVSINPRVTFLVQANSLCSVLGSASSWRDTHLHSGEIKGFSEHLGELLHLLMLHIIQHLAMASQSTNLCIIQRSGEGKGRRNIVKSFSFLTNQMNRKDIHVLRNGCIEIYLVFSQIFRRGRLVSGGGGKGPEEPSGLGVLPQFWIPL